MGQRKRSVSVVLLVLQRGIAEPWQVSCPRGGGIELCVIEYRRVYERIRVAANGYEWQWSVKYYKECV